MRRKKLLYYVLHCVTGLMLDTSGKQNSATVFTSLSLCWKKTTITYCIFIYIITVVHGPTVNPLPPEGFCSHRFSSCLVSSANITGCLHFLNSLMNVLHGYHLWRTPVPVSKDLKNLKNLICSKKSLSAKIPRVGGGGRVMFHISGPWSTVQVLTRLHKSRSSRDELEFDLSNFV